MVRVEHLRELIEDTPKTRRRERPVPPRRKKSREEELAEYEEEYLSRPKGTRSKAKPKPGTNYEDWIVDDWTS